MLSASVPSKTNFFFITSSHFQESQENTIWRCLCHRVLSTVLSICPLLQVRRVLVSLGLPGAGMPQKLTQRALAVAQAVADGTRLEAAVEEARKLR